MTDLASPTNASESINAGGIDDDTNTGDFFWKLKFTDYKYIRSELP